jgi:spermidine/putrescine transport system ATP-binding protein
VKRYGRSCAVDGVNLDIHERAFTTLLGPSGCGKTTILRIIAGFEKPDSGSMVLDGRSLIEVPPERRPVNTVFQNYALFPHLTVFENVAFSLTLQPRTPDPAPRVRRALDMVHMADFGDRYPHQLSGGQQQRVAVARAVVAEPHLLLLDEPLSALDRKMRGHLQTELKDLQRRLGIAFVYVTHDQEEAFALSDIVVVMNRGKIVQSAPPATLYAQPANGFVADFIGSATLIAGNVVRLNHARQGDALIQTPLGHIAAPSLAGLEPGDAALLVVRPEHLRVFTRSLDALACPLLWDGVVRQAVYQGSGYMTGVECAGVLLNVLAESSLPPGQTVAIGLDPSRCFITRTGE